LELVAVLAVIAIVVLGAVVIYRTVTANAQSSAARSEALTLGQNVMSLAAGDGSSPRYGATPTALAGAYLDDLSAELPSKVTATYGSRTTFAQAGKVTVTVSGTAACLTLPPTADEDLTVTNGAC
jgi:type II secretory pathway pseudopilin PulG